MFAENFTKINLSEKTPYYLYDLSILRETLFRARKAAQQYNYEVHYAMKANTNQDILKTVLEYGFGADCVSGNEVKCAVENGFDKKHIVFAGVGKNDDEINYALSQDIFCFNVESIPEIKVINELAASAGKIANIALRINPNVNANTHHYITTGLEENKFGINAWELNSVIDLLGTLKSVKLIGLHFHIGSQINDFDVFKSLCIKINEFQDWFEERGIRLENINAGGGVGVDYHEPDTNLICDFEKYFAIFNKFLKLRPGQQLHFELGRSLVAQCGVLISKVLYVKNGIKTNFAILDAGMTELIRPALYQSYHKIQNISKLNLPHTSKYDVVGPICESSDCFGKAVTLPETERGDLFAIRTAGAYGEVMSSQYNLRDKPRSVLV